MLWSCLSCFPRKHCKFLPDDLLVDILCRLPVEDILRCKQVCRRWNCLMSTPQFNNMHVNYGAAVPTIVAQEYLNIDEWNTKKIVFLEDWEIKREGTLRRKKRHQGILRKKKRIRHSYTCKLLNSSTLRTLMFSYHGLLLLNDLITHLILNPITREQVTFRIPHGDIIVALFFHPVAREYYAMGIRYLMKTMKQEFKLLRLSSLLLNEVDFETGWKKLNYLVPRFSQSPIVKRDAIYWMVEENYPKYHGHTPAISCGSLVIIFDIKREEFHVISHPGDGCDDSQFIRERHAHMHLLEKEDVVTFCEITFHVEDRVKMQLWALEDQYCWSSRWETIILDDMSIRRFPFGYTNGSMSHDVKPVGTLNGELILSWLWRGVFAYHLRLRTLRRLEFNDVLGHHVLIHNKTSLPLKNLLQNS